MPYVKGLSISETEFFGIMKAILGCKNLTMGYDRVIAFHDVSFEIPNGAFLCIVGENGSGKSTLVKGLLGLLKPISGEILFGEDVSGKIGYLPQQSQSQRDFPASVWEVVLSGRIKKHGLSPFYSKSDRRSAKNALDALKIADLKSKSFKNLSGGQQQRVLLARAFCAADKLLLLDEPTSSLDPIASAVLYDIVKELNHDKHMTIIMVSHDIKAAVSMATHILHLGTDQFFGTTEEYINSVQYNNINSKG